VPTTKPPVTDGRTKPVIVRVRCVLRAGCQGTITLKDGTATLGTRTVKLRYRQTAKVAIKLRPRATISRAKRVRVRASRGLRASL
jgi:hypothetical protein